MLLQVLLQQVAHLPPLLGTLFAPMPAVSATFELCYFVALHSLSVQVSLSEAVAGWVQLQVLWPCIKPQRVQCGSKVAVHLQQQQQQQQQQQKKKKKKKMENMCVSTLQ
jgi:hypothetical protein